MAKKIGESELVLNPDGSVYHIKLRPENIANDIIIVGDPGRVERISRHFDKIEFKIHNREFITHTGLYKGKKISVVATGIGPDNIDIVINELDALVNIDLEKRVVKDKHTTLNIVRLGTSGALQPDIPVDSAVMSSHGMGFDGLLDYYKTEKGTFEDDISDAFMKHSGWLEKLPYPYVAKCSPLLRDKIGTNNGFHEGITATAPGFYGPQGRVLRLQTAIPDLNEKLETFTYKGQRITNFEMETSALYGLSTLLGHNALTVCAIIANRIRKEYSTDYKKFVDVLIEKILTRLVS